MENGEGQRRESGAPPECPSALRLEPWAGVLHHVIRPGNEGRLLAPVRAGSPPEARGVCRHRCPAGPGGGGPIAGDVDQVCHTWQWPSVNQGAARRGAKQAHVCGVGCWRRTVRSVGSQRPPYREPTSPIHNVHPPYRQRARAGPGRTDSGALPGPHPGPHGVWIGRGGGSRPAGGGERLPAEALQSGRPQDLAVPPDPLSPSTPPTPRRRVERAAAILRTTRSGIEQAAQRGSTCLTSRTATYPDLSQAFLIKQLAGWSVPRVTLFIPQNPPKTVSVASVKSRGERTPSSCRLGPRTIGS